MNRRVEFSDEFKQLIERRYALVSCLIRVFRGKGVELLADFLKDQFKDLITPSGIHIGTLHGHSGEVRCLAVVGKKLYSGSWDRTIQVWDLDTHKYVASLEGHTSGVRCLTVIENKLYSGTYDRTIRVLDTDTHQCITNLEGHNAICLIVVGNKVYSWEL